MYSSRAVCTALCLFVGVCAARLPAQARVQTEVPVGARTIFNHVMSPFCPELLLANCPTSEADSLRHAIILRINAGESPRRVEEELVVRYGVSIRGAPSVSGFGLMAWLVPGLMIVAGCISAAIWIRRSSVAATSTVSEPETLAARDRERLEKLMRDW